MKRRAFARGFFHADGRLGQFVLAPLSKALISAFGWVTAPLTQGALTDTPPAFWLGSEARRVADTMTAREDLWRAVA